MRDQNKYFATLINLDQAKLIIQKLNQPFLIHTSFYNDPKDDFRGFAAFASDFKFNPGPNDPNIIKLNTALGGNNIGTLIHELAHITIQHTTTRHTTNFYKEFWRLIRKYEELVQNKSF